MLLQELLHLAPEIFPTLSRGLAGVRIYENLPFSLRYRKISLRISDNDSMKTNK